MEVRQHAFMENAHDKNGLLVQLPEKHHVLALLQAPIPLAHLIVRAPELRVICQLLTAMLQLVEVASALLYTPGATGVLTDLEQVFLGPAGEAKTTHG